MKETKTCNRCGGECKSSKALVNYHHCSKSYLRGEKEFETKLLNCLKCVNCGHSFIPEKSTRELVLE